MQIRRVLLDAKNGDLCPDRGAAADVRGARAERRSVDSTGARGRAYRDLRPLHGFDAGVSGRAREASARRWFTTWIGSPAGDWCPTSRWSSISIRRRAWRARTSAASGTHDVETRLDQESLAFHRKVREAYHQLAEDEPRRVRLIDGSRTEAEVAADVWATVEPLLSKR